MYVACGGIVGCNQGLKSQEMCSLQWQNQRSGKRLEGRQDLIVCKFSLRE